ncbi:hypothetical protein [Gracilibacillus phocaeensis]|uniref:hypothetical protein n=1 Tax=Gracilibacillus phocaeensis TaxID=2042304 RepID=UPI001031149F|nr:hypothetical protein [Gracilibacillus phocaeensis]
MNIAVLHAHHSNIDYMEPLLATKTTKQLHYVDPGLLYIIPKHSTLRIKKLVAQQLARIAESNPDLILITCTNYALYIEDPSISEIPIIKLDDLFFRSLQSFNKASLYFTNPQTVAGTMKRMNDYTKNSIPKNYQTHVIEGIFDWIMANEKDKYDQAIVQYILEKPPEHVIAFPQLSMSNAAKILRQEGLEVLTPIDALQKYLYSYRKLQ